MTIRSARPGRLLVVSWILLATPAAAITFRVSKVHAAAMGRPGALAFVPVSSEAGRRGAEAIARFGLGNRYQLTFDVANAFLPETRDAVARVEARLAAVPGVKRVWGPSRLLDLSVEANGRVQSLPLFSGERADDVAWLQGRLDDRQDAVGWFIASDGTSIRMLVDTDDPAVLREPLGSSVDQAELPLLGGPMALQALWPDPARDPLPFGRHRPLQVAVLAMLVPLLALGFWAAVSWARALLCALAAGFAAASPGLLAPVTALRTYAFAVGLAAAALTLALCLLGALSRRLRRNGPLRPMLSGNLAPPAVIMVSVALLAGTAALSPRLRLESELGHETPFVFIDLRADLTEPVVLREIRRLTELLEVRPGVQDAWSVADLFSATASSDRGFGGIPDDRGLAAAILTKAARDPAVALAVTPDLREALITVRLDETSGFDRTRVIDGIKRLLVRNLRPALAGIDVGDESLPRPMRAFGRGMLAEDARLRVARLCQREGRNVAPEEEAAIDQSLRRVVLAPRLDPRRFRDDVSTEVVSFLEQTGLAERRVGLPHPAERQRLIDGLLALPGAPAPAQVAKLLGELWGRRTPARLLETRGVELAHRLVNARRLAIANGYARTILADANLPSVGALADEVREATLEAMGPIIGIPVSREAPNALVIDAAVVGAAASDRALAVAWGPRIRIGVLLAALGLAALLFLIGGVKALGYWPAALAPAALVLLVPAVAGLPMGSLLVALFAGALGGGAGFAVGFSPVRFRRAR